MAYNSTIRSKNGICSHPGCKYYGPLTKKLCYTHYWSSIRMKSVAKLEEKENSQNESLTVVMDELDIIFSQYMRLIASDENGYCTCAGCGIVLYYTEMHNCHFIPRSHKNTRYLEDNCLVGCPSCNRNTGGKLSSGSEYFGNLIESKRLGGVELLEEQGMMAYNYSVSEIKGLISHYSSRVRQMKKTKPFKV